MSLLPPSATFAALPTRCVIYCPSLLAYTGKRVVGKKILNPDAFLTGACRELSELDEPLPSSLKCEEWTLPLSSQLLEYVSSGIGAKRGHGTRDFVVRKHKGHLLPCLRREFAFQAEEVSVKVVATSTYRARYEKNAGQLSEEALAMATHIIVDFHVVAGPAAARSALLNPYDLLMRIAREQVGLNSSHALSKQLLREMKKFALVAD